MFDVFNKRNPHLNTPSQWDKTRSAVKDAFVPLQDKAQEVFAPVRNLWNSKAKQQPPSTPETATETATETPTTTGTPLTVGRDDYWGGVGAELGTSTQNVLQSQVDGRAFNPFATQQREAQARAEANQRAANAQQIHSAGFGGTPLGAMAGNATEAALLRNRFDNALGLEVERQNTMREGAGMAMDYADRVNRFGNDKLAQEMDRFVFETTKYDTWGEDFNNFMATHPNTVDAMMSGDPLAIAGLRNDPGYVQAMSNLHRREGGDGNFTDAWAQNKIANWQASQDQGVLLRKSLKSILPDWSDDEISAAIEYITTQGVGVTRDGTPIDAPNQEETLRGYMTGRTPFRDYPGLKSDPVYQEMLEQTNEFDNNQKVVGYRKGTEIQGPGIGRETKPGHTQFSELEIAFAEKKPVKIGDTLYYVDSVSRANGRTGHGGTTGTSTYVLVDPTTGNRITKSTTSNSLAKL